MARGLTESWLRGNCLGYTTMTNSRSYIHQNSSSSAQSPKSWLFHCLFQESLFYSSDNSCEKAWKQLFTTCKGRLVQKLLLSLEGGVSSCPPDWSWKILGRE